MKKNQNFRNKKVYLFGFSRWKHSFVKVFLKEYSSKNIYFISPLFKTHLTAAINKGLDSKSDIFIWGKKDFKELEEFASSNAIPISRVEDGFIRSVGLGSDLTQPYSLVIDSRGIYFDPHQESDLEKICNSYDFVSDANLLERSKSLIAKIKAKKLSKYNADAHKDLVFPTDKKVILVPGQVQDDASIRLGGEGMKNSELLQKVKESVGDSAYIIYKPHPDVLSGNRIGHVPSEEALRYCNEIVKYVSMASLLDVVDEVHTITSLTGFEALLYGKKVCTYGVPFYSGWGLTQDKKRVPRRKAKLSLEELVAATLLLYPRYINPKTFALCSAEEVIDFLETQKTRLEGSYRARIEFKIRNYISRLGQKILSLVVN